VSARAESREVLLVEDNPADAKLAIKAFAKSAGDVHVSVVEDGEQALTLLRRGALLADESLPDLILLDLNLPRLDGREVLAAIKRNPRLKQIPVIVLTGSNASMDVLTSYRLHANGYVRKPFSFADLAIAVKKIHDFWLTLATLPNDA